MIYLKNTICTLILFIITFVNLYSQENFIYKNDYLSPFLTNPACTGAEFYPIMHLSYKKQWLGFPGSPGTILLTGNTKLGRYNFYNPKGFINKGPLELKERIGLGAAIFYDQNGPLSNVGGLLSYAYHIRLNNDSKLSLGMSLLMMNYSLNTSILKPDQINDDFLLADENSIFKSNFGVGIYYYSKNYFAGISANKLLPGISNINDPTKRNSSFFALAGYKFEKIGGSFDFEPSFAVKKIANQNIFFDLHSKLYFQKLNWVAISYSTVRQMNIQFALRVIKAFYIGYNYGYTFSKIANYNYGSHEISLGINMGLVGMEGIRESF